MKSPGLRISTISSALGSNFPNLFLFFDVLSAYRCVSRCTEDGFKISTRWQRCLHSVCPSAVERQHFLVVLLPCSAPEIILKEVCQPTEVTWRDWCECEPIGFVININFSPVVQWGPAHWWEGLGRAACFCGWLSFELASRTRWCHWQPIEKLSRSLEEEDAVPSRAARKLLAYSKVKIRAANNKGALCCAGRIKA